MKKATGAIDKEIGTRIRMRRVLIGMSQERLGDLLGITFQQVQKYEKGTNRISVGRMMDIARVLGVDIHYFFDNLVEPIPGLGDNAAPAYVADFMSTPEGLQLMRFFVQIKDPKLRRGLVQFAGTLAEAETRSP